MGLLALNDWCTLKSAQDRAFVFPGESMDPHHHAPSEAYCTHCAQQISSFVTCERPDHGPCKHCCKRSSRRPSRNCELVPREFYGRVQHLIKLAEEYYEALNTEGVDYNFIYAAALEAHAAQLTFNIAIAAWEPAAAFADERVAVPAHASKVVANTALNDHMETDVLVDKCSPNPEDEPQTTNDIHALMLQEMRRSNEIMASSNSALTKMADAVCELASHFGVPQR